MFVFNLVRVIFSTHLEKQICIPAVTTLMQVFVIKRNSVIKWVWDIFVCFYDADDLAGLFSQAFTVAEQNPSSKGPTRNQRTLWIKWLPLQYQSPKGTVLAVNASGKHTACPEAGLLIYFFLIFVQ